MDDLEREWRREDVGFALDALVQFGDAVQVRTWEALEFCNGDADQLDVPNLAADVVPQDEDEVLALVHLLTGKPSDDVIQGRKLLYDYAFTRICQAMITPPSKQE
jgi:hypothetical protein